MAKLYEAAYLVSISDDMIGHIEDTFPEGAVPLENQEYFLIDCFPGQYSKTKPIVFTFTIGTTFYYTLSFPFNEKTFEIIIESKNPFAYIFSTFLKETITESSKNDLEEPALRFAYVASLLASWDNNLKTNIEMDFPTGLTSACITEGHNTYRHYNYWEHFTNQDLTQAYDAIIYDQTILITADDPNTANKAAFTLFSLLSPIQYTGPFALWMPSKDPRIDNIAELGFKLVCSPDTRLLENDYFKVKFKVSPKNTNGLPEIREQFSTRNKFFVNLFSIVLDENLMNDPFYDILNVPLDLNMVKDIAQNDFGVPIEDRVIIAFNNHNSWNNWRKQIIYRANWCDALKSLNPSDILAIHQNQNELQAIKEALNKTPNDILNDKHLKAVIRNYKKLIDQMLK